MNKDMILGIDIGGTTIKIGYISNDGKLVDAFSIDTDISNHGNNIIPDIIDIIKTKISDNTIDINKIVGIGIGSPGTINDKECKVSSAFNLNWQEEKDLSIIGKTFNLPIYIDNDANVAALGEKWQGAGKNASDVVFVTLGTGVGGGIVVNGNITHGINNAAGEIGHIYVADGLGFKCTCGNIDCLETLASATGIVNVYKHICYKDSDISAKEIFDNAQKGDRDAIITVKKVCKYLGTTFANIANILNPSYIIIGGGVSQAGEYLRMKVEDEFNNHVFPSVRTSTKVRIATLQSNAGILGAAYLVASKEI